MTLSFSWRMAAMALTAAEAPVSVVKVTTL